MSARDPPPEPEGGDEESRERPPAQGAPEIPRELRQFLALAGGHVLIIRGPPGSGKSTLATELIDPIDGQRVVVSTSDADQVPATPGPSDRRRRPPILRLSQSENGRIDHHSRDDRGGPMLAAGAVDDASEPLRPPWVDELVARIGTTDRAYVVVDPWMPTTPLPTGRSAGGEGASPVADREIQALRSALRGTPVHLILVGDTEVLHQSVSTADAIVETGFDALPGGRIRVLQLQKMRGVTIGTAEYPYSLADGRFRCAIPLPSNFRPPVAPPDPAPAERPGYLWPGTNAWARVFGWLRLGAISGLELGELVPDDVIPALVLPFVAHTLRTGGRVLWVPLPSTVPERMVDTLSGWMPEQTVATGLRVLSAGGEESHPLLKSTLLPLRVPAARAASAEAGTVARVAPSFTEGLKFLKETEAGHAAVFLLAFDGLRAVAALTGAQYDPATFPVLVARYAELPGFHGLGISRAGDPLSQAARGIADLRLRLDGKHGRVFVTGLRPETAPHLLSWEPGDPRYRLDPMI
ncbi:MAG: ATP-binding protein [Thermoplasmata archaeon]|nr:ATP-binding protein [Thermoplasmata archaeon]